MNGSCRHYKIAMAQPRKQQQIQRWRRQKTEVGRWLLILGTLTGRRAVL